MSRPEKRWPTGSPRPNGRYGPEGDLPSALTFGHKWPGAWASVCDLGGLVTIVRKGCRFALAAPNLVTRPLEMAARTLFLNLNIRSFTLFAAPTA